RRPHWVRAAGAAGAAAGKELRRVLDGVRVTGRGAHRARRGAVSAGQGCGAPAGGAAMPAGASGEAVIEGHVTRAGAPLPAGYARLLNDGGEFGAQVPL